MAFSRLGEGIEVGVYLRNALLLRGAVMVALLCRFAPPLTRNIIIEL
jgi:hypothetical protein